MNDDLRLDLSEIHKNLREGNVFCLYFPMLQKTLLLDLRTAPNDPPVVRLLPKAADIEDRLQSIKELRPGQPAPERVVMLPWGKQVDSLVRLGIWELVLDRCAATSHADTVKQCAQALDALRRLERQELAAAVTGERYQTIWQAPRQ